MSFQSSRTICDRFTLTAANVASVDVAIAFLSNIFTEMSVQRATEGEVVVDEKLKVPDYIYFLAEGKQRCNGRRGSDNEAVQ